MADCSSAAYRCEEMRCTTASTHGDRPRRTDESRNDVCANMRGGCGNGRRGACLGRRIGRCRNPGRPVQARDAGPFAARDGESKRLADLWRQLRRHVVHAAQADRHDERRQARAGVGFLDGRVGRTGWNPGRQQRRHVHHVGMEQAFCTGCEDRNASVDVRGRSSREHIGDAVL